MRTLLLRLALAGLPACGLCLNAAVPAASAVVGADVGQRCEVRDATTGRCQIWITIPGAGGSTGGGHGASGDGPPAPGRAEPKQDDEGAACYSTASGAGISPGPVPCSNEFGSWSAENQCYLSPTPSPVQPPRGGPGTDPVTGDTWTDQGAFYDCALPNGGGLATVWLDAPPQQGPPPPTPGEVARQAVARMDLRAIEIGIAPPDGAIAVVGVPVWLWVADPGASTFGPATATASVRGVTVTATASVQEVRWTFGDGTELSCGVGTPYDASFGGAPSPDCGHVYQRQSGFEPGGVYPVTATTTWVVEWAGAGQSGTITLDPLVAETAVVVAEGQVLVG